MSTEIPPLGIAILSLLDERDMHPYEMIQTLRARKEDQWVKLRPGSLYHQVERLAAHGYAHVVGTEQDGNRPPRTTYSLTPSGHDILTAWVRRELGTVENSYLPISLALGEISSLSPDEACSVLQQRSAQLEADRLQLDADLGSVYENAPRIFLLAHEHKRAVLTTERDFVNALITDIESGELAWPNRQ